MLLWTLAYIYLYEIVFSFSSDNEIPGVKLLDHTVVRLLVFWGHSIRFSTVATPIYIPTNSLRRFPFLHILTNTCYKVWNFNFFLKKICIDLAAPGLSWGMQDLWSSLCHVESLVGTWELICGTWDLVLQPGMETGPSALGAWSLSHCTGPPGNSLKF